MARTVTVKVGNAEWHMPASYAASTEIAEAVEDPLKLAMRAERGELEFTTDMVVSMIHIGCKHAGCSLTKEKVGEAIYEQGLASYLDSVGEYIAALVMGGPERPVHGEGKKKKRSGSRS